MHSVVSTYPSPTLFCCWTPAGTWQQRGAVVLPCRPVYSWHVLHIFRGGTARFNYPDRRGFFMMIISMEVSVVSAVHWFRCGCDTFPEMTFLSSRERTIITVRFLPRVCAHWLTLNSWIHPTKGAAMTGSEHPLHGRCSSHRIFLATSQGLKMVTRQCRRCLNISV